MSTSYNGWPASPNLPLRPLVVAGEAFVPGVLDNDDVWTIFNYLANRLHNEVEPIYAPGWHEMDDWGFSYRYTTNDNSYSCHASGTAIDYNATRHPYGRWNTFTANQQQKIHEIIADLPIVWGGDYRYTPDDMHFEIMGSRAAVAAAAARIRNNNIKKDWFDMATEAELREIVREVVNNNTPSSAQIRAIVAEELDTKFDVEQFPVRKPDGSTRLITYTQLLKELWQKINKHA